MELLVYLWFQAGEHSYCIVMSPIHVLQRSSTMCCTQDSSIRSLLCLLVLSFRHAVLDTLTDKVCDICGLLIQVGHRFFKCESVYRLKAVKYDLICFLRPVLYSFLCSILMLQFQLVSRKKEQSLMVQLSNVWVVGRGIGFFDGFVVIVKDLWISGETG